MARRKREIGLAFRRVLACFDGNKAECARRIGVESRQVVDYWLKLGYIPARHALKASLATGNEVSVVELLHEAERFELKRAALQELKAKAAIAERREEGSTT